MTKYLDWRGLILAGLLRLFEIFNNQCSILNFQGEREENVEQMNNPPSLKLRRMKGILNDEGLGWRGFFILGFLKVEG